MRNSYLGLEEDLLSKKGGFFTAFEIAGQPELWLKTWDKLVDESPEISAFLNSVLSKSNLQIILTGAGTSAYIGEVLEGPFQKNSGIPVRAVPTTNLVTHPELYFLKESPTLLISFARSGNSPESFKAVSLAKDYCNEIYNFVITCNAEGKLALESRNGSNDFVFVLPSEANDKSLAMTGSFTAMLLTGLLMSRLEDINGLTSQKEIIYYYGKRIIDRYSGKLKEVANLEFTRVVFLGSGLFEGVARESQLKLQELSDGKIICKHDTFLGFRHGPKAVINGNTLLVYIFSNNRYSQKYEIDLVKSVNSGRKTKYKIGIMEHDIDEVDVDLKIILSGNGESVPEEFLTVVSVLPAQILGFYKSLALGLKPDNPSEDGMITRVVQGVKLYEYNGVEANGYK